MELFLNNVLARTEQYREQLLKQGISGSDLSDRLERHVITKMDVYYAKLMEVFSEEDYQRYRRAIETRDKTLLTEVMIAYTSPIMMLQQDFLEYFEQ